jgi:transcriptional regulator with XRE-family HTH domain
VGLSQDEVAFLLGCQNGTKVSRYERFDRKPGLETAMAYQIVFGAPARELFAGIYQKVEGKISKRAQLLAQRLSKEKPGLMATRKIAALRAISRSEPEPAKTL